MSDQRKPDMVCVAFAGGTISIPRSLLPREDKVVLDSLLVGLDMASDAAPSFTAEIRLDCVRNADRPD
jgi:hypothetical protein